MKWGRLVTSCQRQLLTFFDVKGQKADGEFTRKTFPVAGSVIHEAVRAVTEPLLAPLAVCRGQGSRAVHKAPNTADWKNINAENPINVLQSGNPLRNGWRSASFRRLSLGLRSFTPTLLTSSSLWSWSSASFSPETESMSSSPVTALSPPIPITNIEHRLNLSSQQAWDDIHLYIFVHPMCQIIA